MKRYTGLLFIFLFLFSLLNDCKKIEEIPMGNLEPGVALTFDDASLSQWVELLPMFQKYGVRATFFICTACTYGIPLDDSLIIQLSEAGNEIGCHTEHHEHLLQYLETHSLTDYYKYEIVPSIQYFDSLNIPVSSFAYPYGEHNSESNKFLSNYFEKIRGICSLLPSADGAFITYKNRILVNGSFIDRASPYHLEDFKRAIKQAKDHRAVLVLIGHSPGSDPTNDWSFPVSLLDSICSYTVQQKMKFYRLRDL
jgi:peptidoglycan/xylan/chitin deacetylase (PgdA/CDA1 family)